MLRHSRAGGDPETVDPRLRGNDELENQRLTKRTPQFDRMQAGLPASLASDLFPVPKMVCTIETLPLLCQTLKKGSGTNSQMARRVLRTIGS